MPKLGQYQWLLDSVFFLYRSKADAVRGVRSGGTGFIFALEAAGLPGVVHVYGITNWHVACRDGCSVIRINRRQGPPDVFELGPEDWVFLEKGPDLAATPLQIDPSVHRASALALDWLLTDEQIAKSEVNAGDDVFMVGRFVDYDGVESNSAALRFGHVSMMSAPIKQPTGYSGPSVIVDMHSRTGYSGSPVFIYRTHGSIFAEKENSLIVGKHFMMLLGVHWGQFPEAWELADKTSLNQAGDTSLITEGKYVVGLSGMTCAVPSAAIAQLLDLPIFKGQRAANEQAIRQRPR